MQVRASKLYYHQSALPHAKGVGSRHRCYGVAENLKRIERALQTVDDMVKDTPEYKAVADAAATVKAKNDRLQSRYASMTPEERTEAGPPAFEFVPVDLEVALRKKEEEFAGTEIEFDPYIFDSEKLGDLTVDMFDPKSRPSPQAAMQRALSAFYDFVADFDALPGE